MQGLSMPRRLGRRNYSRSRDEPMSVLITVIIIGLLAYVALRILWEFRIYVLIIILIILSVLIYLFIRKYRKRRAITSEIDKYLRNALEIMDTTGKWYNNEEEANRELVSCLKSQKIDATYQYKLPNGRTADAKVGNVLIEGKLSPSTADVDRLLGQLTEYTKYPDKINVVIYGRLYKDMKRRIENEIQQRYPNKVFLTYLENPKRQRASSW